MRAFTFTLLALIGCARSKGESPPPAAASDAAPIATLAPPPPVVEAAPPAPSHEPTILVVGDSHTYGAFGYRLHQHLAQLGKHLVVSEAAGGATTDTYLEEHPEARVGYRVRESARGENAPRELVSQVRAPMTPLGDLLTKYDPDVVVVALGTNRPMGSMAESIDTFLARLLRERPERRVFWIGPPAVLPPRGAGLVASIRIGVEKHPAVTFIDSTTFNADAPLPSENPHFSPDDARRWADVAFAQIEPRLAPP